MVTKENEFTPDEEVGDVDSETSVSSIPGGKTVGIGKTIDSDLSFSVLLISDHYINKNNENRNALPIFDICLNSLTVRGFTSNASYTADLTSATTEENCIYVAFIEFHFLSRSSNITQYNSHKVFSCAKNIGKTFIGPSFSTKW